MFDIPNLSVRIESLSPRDVRELMRTAENGAPLEDLDGPNTEILVARLNGVAVGCIALVDHVRFGEAKRLYVDPDVRGNGIGAALVSALESAARDIGIRKLSVHAISGGYMSPSNIARYGFQASAPASPVLEKHL